MKRISYIFLGLVLGLATTLFAAQISVPSASGPGFLLQSTSTGQYLPVSLTAGSNVTISTTTSNITISATGGGGTFPFTVNSWGNSTTSTLGFLNGFLSTASSTISSALRLPSLTQGVTYIGSTGLINSIATSSIGAGNGLTFSGTSGHQIGGTDGTYSIDSSLLSTNGLITWNGTKLVATGTPQLTIGNLLATSTNATSTVKWHFEIGSSTLSTATCWLCITAQENNVVQAQIQNKSSGSNASSDWVATADNGSDSTHYINMGINGSGGSLAPFTTANHAYLYSIDDPLNIGALGASAFITFNTTGGTSPVERARIGSNGNLLVGTTTDTGIAQVVVSSTTGSQLSLSAGAGLAQWVMRNAGGALYIATTTTTGTATTSTAAIEISNTGFGTTTIRGLNISSVATTTSNIGFNVTGGCYAINGTCVGGGSGSPGGATTQIQYNSSGAFAGDANLVWDTTNTRLGIASSTPNAQLSVQGITTSQQDLVLIASSTTGAPVMRITKNGAVTFQNSVNSTAGFSIVSGAGTNLFLVDTTNSKPKVSSLDKTTTGALVITGGDTVSGATIGRTGVSTAATTVLTVDNTTFQPTTGAVNYTALTFGGTLNQTGPSTGLSKMINIGPTITRVSDYRAIDIASSTVLTNGSMGSSQAVMIGQFGYASSSATTISTTSAISLSTPYAGSNMTITNTAGLVVNAQATSSKAGTGSVTNAYGIYVNSPTSATRNYSATFMGGNVGIGSSTPVSALVVNGAILTTEAKPATSTSMTIDLTSSTQHLIQNGTSALTVTLSGLYAGQTGRVVVCNPAGGTPGTVSWATSPANSLLWTGGTTPTQTTTANKCDLYTFTVTQATSTTGAIQVLGGYVQNF